jgi:hypothetical protein
MLNSRPRLQHLLVNRWLAWLLSAALLALVVTTTLQYRRVETQSGPERDAEGSMLVADANTSRARILNDYDDFYVVGRLFREGDILAAYDNAYLTAAQQRFTGTTTFMPWAYPPPLTAAVALLPLAGLAWSYLLFMVATLLLYLWTLSRFGAKLVGASMLAVFPALVLVVRLGQNGMLTGALIGLFLLGLRGDRNGAGVPLGLMMIKPHLAIALGLLALLKRRWTLLAIAVAVVLGLCVVATAVLGFGVWPAFFSGAAAAGGYLSEGLFPLYRMSSIYAGVRSFDAAPHTAMAVHVTGALAALGSVAVAWRAGLRTNRLLALTCFATLFVSPYNYDYDTVCLAVAVTLILPELLARARTAELVAFYVLAWIGTGAGLAQHFHAVLIAGTTDHRLGSSLSWSFQAVGLLATAALVAVILRRPQAMSVVTGQAGGLGAGKGAKGAA